MFENKGKGWWPLSPPLPKKHVEKKLNSRSPQHDRDVFRYYHVFGIPRNMLIHRVLPKAT